MLHDWDRRFPGRVENVFRAMQNVVPSHLADSKLFDFAGVAPHDEPVAEGDIAFDQEPVTIDAIIPVITRQVRETA